MIEKGAGLRSADFIKRCFHRRT